MEIFDKLGDALSTTGKEVANLAKDLTGSAKLNLQMKEEELNIKKLYYQLGKQYYEANKDCPDETYEGIFKSINNCEAKIARYKEELKINKGVRTCPNCNTQYPQSSTYCTTCGRDNADVK